MTFDPTPYLIQLRGRGGTSDYLETKWRLVWLRSEHPDAIIETTLIETDDKHSIFKASVTIPGGGSATGWKQETVGDFRDHLEKSETGATGRALAALGYGTQFVGADYSEGLDVADASVDRTSSAPYHQQAVRPRTETNDQREATTVPQDQPQPPTEKMLNFAISLAAETRLDGDDLAVWLTELFGPGHEKLTDLNMAQTSTLINQLQRRKSARN